MKIKKLAIITVVAILLALIFGIHIYIKSERLYEKYVKDGDKWVCDKPKIELTYYTLKKIGTNTYNDITVAEIEGIDSEVIIGCVGGHSKNWDFIYANDYTSADAILSGYYEIIDENTLVLHVSNDSASTVAEPGSDLTFKKVNNER